MNEKNYGFLALLSLVPNAKFSRLTDNYADLLWEDERLKPTESAWRAEKARLKMVDMLNECKTEAKKRIAEYDWVMDDTTTPKLSNKSEFYTYRSALRELILNPVENPVWPEIPQEVWE